MGERSFAGLSVEDIAARAQLTRSAFLKRFGSKQQALLLLFQRYCDDCSAALVDLAAQLPAGVAAADAPQALERFCVSVSQRLEALLHRHFPANRAMHELFMEELRVAEPTKLVFLQTADLMRRVQHAYLGAAQPSDAGAFAAAQLLVTVNYNHALHAMPAFPADAGTRHRLIGALLAHTLRL